MSDSASQDAKTLWQNQETESTTVTLDDIRKRAGQFQRRVRNRNRREYIASAVVIAAFGVLAWQMPGWMMKLGSVLIVTATLFVVWQLHRRGRAQTVPDGAAAGLLAFHREELVRQREMLRTVWLWYLAPFVPGMALILLARYFQLHTPGRSLAVDHLIIVFGAMIMALVFVIILLLNLWVAARLQNRIHELDRLKAE
ncbi:MAG: hypothetical protein WDM91_21475 [Rhizomicrobium sp.]